MPNRNVNRPPKMTTDRLKVLDYYVAGCVLAALGLACAQPPSNQAPAPVEAQAPAPPGLRARGQKAAIRSLELVVEEAVVTGDDVTLSVAFKNVSEDSYALAGDLKGEDLRLAAEGGATYPPRSVSAELRHVDPPGGFAPGQRKDGQVVFRRPRGRPPFRLELPGFEPLVLSVRHLTSAAAAPAAAPADPEPASVAPRPQWMAQLDHLLERQANALERSDAEAYLATFVDDPEVRRRELKHLRHKRLVPITEARLEIETAPTSAHPKNWRSYRSAVTLTFRLQDLPEENPFLHQLMYSFVQEGNDWRVAKIRDDPKRPVLWFQDELLRYQTHHFLAYADSEKMRHDLARIAAEVEGAYASLYSRRFPMAGRYLIQLLSEPRTYARVAGNDGSLGVAVTYFRQAGNRPPEIHSRTFYINGSVFLGEHRKLYRKGRGTTVAHELVHLALANLAVAYAPDWVNEGAAVFFSNDLPHKDNRDLARRLDRLDLAEMTRSGVMSHENFELLKDQYTFAGNVVSYLVKHRGQELFLEFYQSYDDWARDNEPWHHGQATPNGHELATAEGLEACYGLTIAELDAAVKTQMTQIYR